MDIFKAVRGAITGGRSTKHLPPEAAPAVLRAKGAEAMLQTKVRHFQYVLVHTWEEQPDEIPKLICNVVDALLRHSGTVTDITSSLVIGYFGLPYPEYDSVDLRRSFVTALLAKNGKAVRVAHGQCNGLVGTFGNKSRHSFGAIVPNFSDILKTLLDAEFGTAIEIP